MNININIDHHLFGKLPDRDFSTVFSSIEFDKETLRILELNSRYSLPTSLLYSDKEKPKKYVFYKLKNWFVFGRGIDYGRDEFNRPGNFLFHNILVNVNELENKDIKPVELLNFFDKHTFTDKIDLNEKLYPKNITIIKEPNDLFLLTNLVNNEKIINYLYSLIFNYKSFNSKVIWLIGYNDQTFKFLNTLFYLIPERFWFQIYFNTLLDNSSEIPNGISVICTLPEDKTNHINQFLIKIDLITNNFEISNKIEGLKNEYALLFAKPILNDDKDKKNLFYQLDNIFFLKKWDELYNLLDLKKLNNDTLFVFYDYWKEVVIDEIKKGDLNLYERMKSFIMQDDLKRIYKSEKFLTKINKPDKDQYISEFLNWFINSIDYFERKFLYNQLFSFDIIFRTLLNNIFLEKDEKHIKIINEILQDIISDNLILNDKIAEDLLYNLIKLIRKYSKQELSVFKETYKILKHFRHRNFKQNLLLGLFFLKFDENKIFAKLVTDKKFQDAIFELFFFAFEKEFIEKENNKLNEKTNTNSKRIIN